MQRIIAFITKYKEYFSFTLLVIISLFLISMGNVTRIGGFRTVVIGGMGWFQSIFSFIPNPLALKSENQALRELNLQYSSEITKMRQALLENKNLRMMLGYRKTLDKPFVVAEVVGRTTIEMRNYLTLDVGKNNGVEEGNPVRNDAGLVGIVLAASGNYSLVELVQNRDIKVAAKVLRSGYPGLIVWEGGEEYVMKDMPKSYDVKKGDMIVTSDFSNKYPAGVPIGYVSKAIEEKGELFLKVLVKPLVNFSTLQQVFVLKYLPNPEHNRLIRELDEKLKLRKMPVQREDKIQLKDEKKPKKEQKKDSL